MCYILLFALIGSVLGFEDVTVIQYLRDHGFHNLTEAIEKVGITDLLNTTGPYTIFAPTDDAFLRAGVVSLDIFTPVQLKAITEYTIVPEFVLIPNVETMIIKNTLADQNLTIEPAYPTLLLNNISYVYSTNNDLIVSNGVIQPVDTMLSPPEWPSQPELHYTIYQQILLNNHIYTDLALAIVLAEMDNMFQTGEYTLFAPTDAAFAKNRDFLPNPLEPDAKLIYQELLKNHLVPGARLANQLRDGQTLYTLHNTPLIVSIGTGIQVDNANVIDTDLIATNGVIHAVDDLLIPADLPTFKAKVQS